MTERFEVSDIIRETRRILAEHAGFIAGIAGAIAGGYIVLDLISESAGNFLNIVVTVFVQYLFFQHVLARRIDPAMAREGRRFGALFGSGLLSTLGILAASILLIVPGIYLAARWSLTSVFVVVERRGATQSLSDSWEATRSSALPVFFAQLMFVAVMVGTALVAIALAAAFETMGIGEWGEIVVVNLVVSLFSVGGWVLAAAIYQLARPDEGSLKAVFA